MRFSYAAPKIRTFGKFCHRLRGFSSIGSGSWPGGGLAAMASRVSAREPLRMRRGRIGGRPPAEAPPPLPRAATAGYVRDDRLLFGGGGGGTFDDLHLKKLGISVAAPSASSMTLSTAFLALPPTAMPSKVRQKAHPTADRRGPLGAAEAPLKAHSTAAAASSRGPFEPFMATSKAPAPSKAPSKAPPTASSRGPFEPSTASSKGPFELATLKARVVLTGWAKTQHDLEATKRLHESQKNILEKWTRHALPARSDALPARSDVLPTHGAGDAVPARGARLRHAASQRHALPARQDPARGDAVPAPSARLRHAASAPLLDVDATTHRQPADLFFENRRPLHAVPLDRAASLQSLTTVDDGPLSPDDADAKPRRNRVIRKAALFQHGDSLRHELERIARSSRQLERCQAAFDALPN
ncbi:hypothetical protein M885DRAFT_524967 [Pelagophyceae sp. CCMP2097]|nr:hypothetical protein M885DRAFT_524967 [Pelagophyceae sp. CCMP2097]